LPVTPGASAFVVLIFWLPVLVRWRIGRNFGPGEAVWTAYVVSVLLLTAAMIMGTLNGAQRLTLRIVTAAFTGIMACWAISIGWRMIASGSPIGPSLLSLLFGALMMAHFGSQIMRWWAQERAGGSSHGMRNS